MTTHCISRAARSKRSGGVEIAPLLHTRGPSFREHRGEKAFAIGTDVSDPNHIARLSQVAVEHFGNVDVRVNNVGVGAPGFFWDIPIEDHARLIDVNLKGMIYRAHAAINLFRAHGYGILINTGSIDSEVPLAYQASYAASKAAVLSLRRTLSEELR